MIKLKTITSIFALAIFSHFTQAQWTQKGADIYGQASQDLFGSSIAMSQDGFVMAVGAPEHSTVNGEVGMVRVLEWNGTDWVQRGQDIVGDVEWNLFGDAVALSSDGSVLAVGAPGIETFDPNQGTAGNVKVFSWNGNSWDQMGAVLTDYGDFDLFGAGLALSSDGLRLAVGAPRTSAGNIQVFDWDGNNWVQVGSTLIGNQSGTFLGRSLFFSPDGMTLTAGGDRFNGNTTAGGVYTYEWDGNDWMETADQIDGDIAEDKFGSAISMSYGTDTLIIIGANQNDDNGNNAGKAVVYKRDGDTWTQYGSALTGDVANGWFGYSVGISGDGSRIIVGAPRNAGNGIGAGQVKIYDWNGTDWQQLGNDFYGSAASDECGRSVVMNYNGRIAAIGAPLNDGNWTDAGQVRVYEDGIQGLNTLSNSNIKIYPNPVENILHIDGLEEGKVEYAFVDLSGRVVLQGALDTENSINVSQLSEGVYTLQLEKDGGVVTEILVKE
jgi:hypothetical protein